jgi:hypothetical protein
MPAATFRIHIDAASDALHRIVCVCHRRHVGIVALDYAGGEMRLTLDGDQPRLLHMERWLGALRDVGEVREVDSATRALSGG